MIFALITKVDGFKDMKVINRTTKQEINIKAVLLKNDVTGEYMDVPVYENEENGNVGIMEKFKKLYQKKIIISADIRPGKGSEVYWVFKDVVAVKE